MLQNMPIFPTQASSFAAHVDHVFFFTLAILVIFSLLICALIVGFALKFRRRPQAEEPRVSLEGFWALEVAWIAIPLAIVMVIFGWGALVYFEQTREPANPIEIFVTGRQWMWKCQHMNGRREINELHIPIGKPVKLTMGSEDVIHSFYVPAFRTKQDAVPGRLTTMWFDAIKTGEFHLFCAEYCGTNHSRMIGRIVAMEPADFQRWLSGATEGAGETGEQLFTRFACNSCHAPDNSARGPSLKGLFGKTVHLASGQAVTAEENYIRESILDPTAKVVAGYQPIMPTFKGQMTEEQLLTLLSYIKSQGASPGQAEAAARGDNPTTSSK